MSDLISRQAAIDAVCNEWCGVKHQECEHIFDVENDESYWCEGCETVLQTLPYLPSAQSEPQWIPCSKKLPEEAGWYLCTYKDGRVNTKYWSKDKGWVDNIRLHMFELYDIRSRLTKEEVKLAQESIYWNDWVVAWSQLPEPYKEGKR